MYKKNAFTLIELLVVIAIIALLASILLPSLKQAKDMAANVTCMTNLRAFGVMLTYYTGENSGRTPSFIPWKFWDKQLVEAADKDFDDDVAVFHCLSDKIDRGASYEPRSYSYNPALCNYSGAYATWGATQSADQGIATDAIPHADQVVALLENHKDLNRLGTGWYLYWADPTWAHFDKSNVLFVDSHVGSVGREDCFNGSNTWYLFDTKYLFIK